MAQPARDQLTLNELFCLFHRTDGDPGRWLGRADSMEFLAVVTYLVAKYNREADNR